MTTLAPQATAATAFTPAPARGQQSAEALLKRLEWQVVRRLDGILQGDYRSLFTGHGYDLAEVREYQPEDDIRYMDWNVTARMDAPYVRQYIEDREITAWLVLDLSPSIDFGTTNERKRDLVVDFTGVMARLLTRHGNRVGAILVDNNGEQALQPRGGQLQTLRLIHELLKSDGRSEGSVDLARALDRINGSLKRRSMVFVVSDFFAAPGWEAPLARLSQRHEVLAVWVTDPREEEIPNVGPMILEDAETGEQVWVDSNDPGFQERFARLVEERRSQLEKTFSRHGIDMLRLSTDGDMVQEIGRFAHLRKDTRRRPVARTIEGVNTR
jgi:uncharacterized protein (DUF58 family)